MKSHLEYQPMDGGDNALEGMSYVQEWSGADLANGLKTWFLLCLICNI